jgi:hypothetical protein
MYISTETYACVLWGLEIQVTHSEVCRRVGIRAVSHSRTAIDEEQLIVLKVSTNIEWLLRPYRLVKKALVSNWMSVFLIAVFRDFPHYLRANFVLHVLKFPCSNLGL